VIVYPFVRNNYIILIRTETLANQYLIFAKNNRKFYSEIQIARLIARLAALTTVIAERLHLSYMNMRFILNLL